MDSAVSFFKGAAHSNLGALGQGIIEKFLDAGEVLSVDDLSDAFLLDAAVFAVQVLPHPGLKLRHQGALLRLLDEYVVRRYAGLPAIELLCCRQIPANLLHVRVLIDDDGRFTSQLQGDGGQMLRGSRHHELAHSRASGKKDM